ncbi:MAG: hypothetical protein ABIR66_13240 [Saprospiraceae bacterium]
MVAGFNWAYDLTGAGKSPINAEGIEYASHPLIVTETGFCKADDIGAHVRVIRDESYGDAMMAYLKPKLYIIRMLGI